MSNAEKPSPPQGPAQPQKTWTDTPHVTASMDINNHIAHLSHKDMPIAGAQLIMGRPPGGGGGVPIAAKAGDAFPSQLMNLDNYYRIQEESLARQYEEQRRYLAQEHHIKMSEQLLMLQKQQQQQELIEKQRQMEEQQTAERKRMENERISMIKEKTPGEQSAVASSEVKAKLRERLLNKNNMEKQLKNPPPEFRQWATQHSSLEQHSPPTSGLSPPLRGPHSFGRYDDEYPLRKTVSEPNLKMRNKMRQKLMQRSSPLVQRRDIFKKNKPPLAIDTTLSTGSSNPDSGPNSPPPGSGGSGSGTGEPTPTGTGKEEGATFPLQMMSKMVINQSMPNIPIGQPRDSQTHENVAGAMTEADLRAKLAVQHGLPLTQHVLTGLPFYPMPQAVLEGVGPSDPAMLEAQLKALELARSTGQMPQLSPVMPGMPYGGAGCITDAQAAQARLQRNVNLHRTNSAPLPLPGHFLYQQHQGRLSHKQHEQMTKENQKHYLKQRLQSSILNRTGSKSHMENVDEEAEARLAQEMKEVRDEEVVVVDDDTTSQTTDKQLVRTMSTPSVRGGGISYNKTSTTVSTDRKTQHTTGVVYDSLMLKHHCMCGNDQIHPENPSRIEMIYERLLRNGLIERCESVAARKASLDELQACHSEAYTLLYGSNPQKLADPSLDPKVFEPLIQRFCKLSCGGIGVDSDTAWNELHTPHAARVAAGCVVEVSMKVAQERCKNGFAIVRPPGHHAEPTQAMGFCFFNSVAIAAKQLLDKEEMKRILILDWDVHHGNSTQQIFYADPRVLYISLHRHDSGNFFPGTGAPEECGIDRGTGFNVNIPWGGNLNPPMGDAEYLAAFRSIVMPIARKFDPEMVLVSAGFDGAAGHPPPLGGYNISAHCFGYMTRELMTLANGKMVLSLEGGYELQAICDAAEMCMRTLLGEKVIQISEEELRRPPCQAALETLETVISCQAPYWPVLSSHMRLVNCTAMEAQRHEHAEDTVTAFASLSVVPEKTAQGEGEEEANKEETSEPMEES